MSSENKILDLTFEAAEDLSDDQYRFVVLTSTGTLRRPDSATEVPLGILQNAPESGGAATVRVQGVSKLQANAALAINLFVKAEYVSAADAGKGTTSVGSEEYARAIVLEAAAAEDDLCSVLLVPPRPAIAIAATEIALAQDLVIVGDGAGAGAPVTLDAGGIVAKTGAQTVAGVKSFTSPLVYDHNTGITAFAGGGQGDAVALTGEYNNVTTCATAGDSVKLLPAVLGQKQTVKNNGAAALDVFPNTDDSINDLAANLAISLPVGGEMTFRGISDTVYESDEIPVRTLGDQTIAGNKTFSSALLTGFGNGAKNGATVTAVEYGDGVIHKTVLTCVATPITPFGDEGGQGQYGGIKVYDFPEGMLCLLGATIDGDITLSAPAIDLWNGDIGLGVEAPTDHQDVANKTGSIMPKVSTTQAVAKVANVDAQSVATALTESGARWIDGTAAAIDLFLNLLVDDDALHDNTITGEFTGTITIAWMSLGDN